jgi:hypothetical protein
MTGAWASSSSVASSRAGDVDGIELAAECLHLPATEGFDAAAPAEVVVYSVAAELVVLQSLLSLQ